MLRRLTPLWLWFGIVPAGFYLLGFGLLTFPLVTTFGSQLWNSPPNDDGWQSLWNLWWVHKALVDLGQLPWFTTWLHYPYGVSLWAHTLSPFNGLFGLALYPLLSFPQIYNVLVLFSFVAGGVTMFYLAFYLTQSYAPSVVAGYVFTFSSFHLAQATEHLNLASLEWLPLFVLGWYALWCKPRVALGVFTAVALGLVTLCDYYYALYCVIAGLVMSVWWVVRQRGIGQAQIKALTAFVLVSLVTTAPFVLPLAVELLRTPLHGHSAASYSLDVVQLVVPGSNWRFAEATRAVWSRWMSNNGEENVGLSIAVWLTLGYVLWQRKKWRESRLGLWFLLLVVFIVLGLGPVLRWNGSVIKMIPMPYGILTQMLPLLQVSGVPIRMMVVVSLSAAVLCGYGLKWLWSGTRRAQLAGLVLTVLMFVEPLPKSFITRPLTIPPYVTALAALPGAEGVLDYVGPDFPTTKKGINAWSPAAMYYQTIHGKPIAFGYVSRTPPETRVQDRQLFSNVRALHLDVVCRNYDMRYFALEARQAAGLPQLQGAVVVYHDPLAVIYDLKPNGRCIGTGLP